MPSPKSTKLNSPLKNPSKWATVEKNDLSVQTERASFCYFCLKEFTDPAAIQAHIALMDHNYLKNSGVHQCRLCKSLVMLKDTATHKCSVMKAIYLRFMSCSTILVYGPPYRCLYCRSKPLSSRVELAMHLLCYHRPNKDIGKCGMCNFVYDEPVCDKPALPTLPANADKEQIKNYNKEVKAIKENQLCSLPVTSTLGLDSLEVHILSDHVPAYMLWNRHNILNDSSLRFPYACPICGWFLKTNYDLHAHILCCHGNPMTIQNDLKICAMCGFCATNDSGLNIHVLGRHARIFEHLGKLWINRELLMNVTDPAVVCAFCWESFKHDFQLQAHVLVAHTTPNVLKCGWCKIDYLSCPDPILAFMIMQHHELNHSRQLQENALTAKLTTQPLLDWLPEEPNKELLINARFSKKMVERENKKKSPIGKKSPRSESSGSKNLPTSKSKK